MKASFLIPVTVAAAALSGYHGALAHQQETFPVVLGVGGNGGNGGRGGTNVGVLNGDQVLPIALGSGATNTAGGNQAASGGAGGAGGAGVVGRKLLHKDGGGSSQPVIVAGAGGNGGRGGNGGTNLGLLNGDQIVPIAVGKGATNTAGGNQDASGGAGGAGGAGVVGRHLLHKDGGGSSQPVIVAGAGGNGGRGGNGGTNFGLLNGDQVVPIAAGKGATNTAGGNQDASGGAGGAGGAGVVGRHLLHKDGGGSSQPVIVAGAGGNGGKGGNGGTNVGVLNGDQILPIAVGKGATNTAGGNQDASGGAGGAGGAGVLGRKLLHKDGGGSSQPVIVAGAGGNGGRGGNGGTNLGALNGDQLIPVAIGSGATNTAGGNQAASGGAGGAGGAGVFGK